MQHLKSSELKLQRIGMIGLVASTECIAGGAGPAAGAPFLRLGDSLLLGLSLSSVTVASPSPSQAVLLRCAQHPKRCCWVTGLLTLTLQAPSPQLRARAAVCRYGYYISCLGLKSHTLNLRVCTAQAFTLGLNFQSNDVSFATVFQPYLNRKTY